MPRSVMRVLIAGCASRCTCASAWRHRQVYVDGDHAKGPFLKMRAKASSLKCCAIAYDSVQRFRYVCAVCGALHGQCIHTESGERCPPDWSSQVARDSMFAVVDGLVDSERELLCPLAADAAGAAAAADAAAAAPNAATSLTNGPRGMRQGLEGSGTASSPRNHRKRRAMVVQASESQQSSSSSSPNGSDPDESDVEHPADRGNAVPDAVAFSDERERHLANQLRRSSYRDSANHYETLQDLEQSLNLRLVQTGGYNCNCLANATYGHYARRFDGLAHTVEDKGISDSFRLKVHQSLLKNLPRPGEVLSFADWHGGMSRDRAKRIYKVSGGGG